MQRRPLTFAVAFALVAGTVIVPSVGAAGRPTCLVSNERTHLGSTTLQAGIDAARAGDTLIVKGTCVGSPPSGSDRAAFNVRKSLTLRGVSNKAFGPATLDGGGVARVLWVDFFPERRGFSLTLESLTITNGFGEDGSGGGGLLAQGGTVVIRDSIVTGNSSGRVGGGGIEAFADSMTITHSTVSNNVAGGDGGGGIYGGGTLIIEDSAITGNVNTRGSAGGLDFNGNLTVRNSTVSGNRARAGGGIFLRGTATLTDSTVSDNTADPYDGGGIVVDSGGSMAIVNSAVSQNASGGSGGGISNRGAMTLVGSVVSGNTAADQGGGIFNYAFEGESGTLDITDSAVSGNISGSSGGGIYNLVGTLDITGSAVTGNVSGWSGGGIANAGATATITSSTVTGNSASSFGGGVINSTTMTISGSTLRENAAGRGGGILNWGTLTFTSPPTRVGGNTATTGGGVHFENSGGTGSVTGGCPVSLGGLVLYSPANTPTDYSGFTCP